MQIMVEYIQIITFISFTRMIQMLHTITLVLVLTFLGSAYDKFNKEQQIIAYYQQYSQYPILHIYHNHHFSNSPQFQDFLQVLEEVEYRNRDYARFLMTDCEEVDEGESFSCDDMNRNKDSRLIIGYYPSTEFTNYAGKRMQNPPLSKRYTHFSDVYKVEEIEGFLRGLIPNFYQQIDNLQQYDEWLKPLYSPNLLFASREEQVPQVLVRLGVHFFLRLDLGYVSDLAQKVIDELNITTFPVLLVIKYNFESETHEIYYYQDTDFSLNHYEKIKRFLQPFALKQLRNDLLFHKIRMPTQSLIQTTESKAELTEKLDRASGWALISLSRGVTQRLEELRQKYGRFFEYYHLTDTQREVETIQMFDPEQKRTFDLPSNDIEFRSLGKEDFLSNTSVWLNKNFVVVGVREKYGHFCTLSLNVFFRGLIRCLIIRESDYEAVSSALDMQFDFGFTSAERTVNGTRRITGQIFNSPDFEQVYLSTEYTTRKKSEEIIDAFFQQPITPVGGTSKLVDICAFPTKKCALLFTHPKKKDRTAFDYLSEIAKNFINEYQFYEIDLSCNPQFAKQIEILQKQSGGLVVYHPQKQSYVYLKAKLSKSTFQRFLKANLGEQKKLPLHKFKNGEIEVHACAAPKKDVEDDSL